MKVRALRLAECGRFQAPVALEGLSGSLDVLVGPNELGKSTLLRAMRFALSEKFSSRKAESLRPYAGGAPTIEIDLEIDSVRWRLRKRYLAQRTADLRCLDDGRLLRGEDAEAKLAELLGGEQGKGRFPLLWLAQGEALSGAEVMEESRPMLETLLATEVQAIASGARARRLQERIRARLSELVTTHASPRPRGRFEAAQKRLRDLEGQHAEWARKATAASDQRDRLAALREREVALNHPAYQAGLEAALTKASAERDAAAAAAAHLASARQAHSLAQARLAAARQAHDAFARTVSGHDTLSLEIESAASKRNDLAASIAAAAGAAEASLAAQAEQRARIAAIEAGLKAARTAARRAELAMRKAAVEQRLREAIALDERRQRVAAELAGITATESTLEAARRELAEIDRLEARLSAAAVGIAVSYVPGAEGRISAGGRSLADAERMLAVEPLILEIAGIGRITVSPGGSDTIMDVQSDIAAHREQLSTLLASASCDSMPALAAAVHRRQQLAGSLAEDKARLSGLAPGGVADLQQECDGLAGELAALPAPVQTASGPSIADLETQLRDALSACAAIDGTVTAAVAEVTRLKNDDARLDASLGERRQRLAALARELPPATERAKQAADLLAAAGEAERSLNETTRQIAAWEEKALPPSEVAKLANAVDSAAAALKARERELASLATEAARIEGELSSLGNENAEAEAAALADTKSDAAAELARIEDEVAALQLLAQEFAAGQEEVRDRFLAPVTARIQPYLELLFPRASLNVDETFAPASLAREGAPEPVARLSDGTREQIAVLGRLAFARLLADGGRAVPLILDDPLVYADDARIAAMFRALELASQSHQVIVLTCHARSFADLGGNRVALAPWSMG